MKTFLTVSIIFFSLLTTNSSAQQITAYVDMQRVVNESTMGKEAQSEISRISQQKQKELDRAKSELEDLVKEKEKEDQLTQKSQELQQKFMVFEQEIQQISVSKLEAVILRIKGVASEIAKENSYTYVIDTQYLLYGNGDLDLTDQVIARMNN